MKSLFLTASMAVLATGCAKSTKEISAQYVSPLQYANYNCQQLEMEAQAVSRRVAEIGGQVNKTASDDNAQMGVGLVLFWPALFFLDGDTPQAAEYARLRGEFDAIEKASIQKECGFRIEHPKIEEAKADTKQPAAFPSKTKGVGK
jgi:hypothetical protein